MNVKTHDALDALAKEREYQDERWANFPSSGHHETGAYLTFINSYVMRAMVELTENNEPLALDTVRKIGALAVACMEDNGIVFRSAYKGRIGG